MSTGRVDAREAKWALKHIRGLDGIRALSVLAIIAFHSGLSWLPGGYYGVDGFFVLSGFLITMLLVGEWGASGTIGLRHFWGRRARRLLPALFVLVAAIGIVMATLPGVFSTPHALADALSTVFYSSNWYLIHIGVPYFSLSGQPSPWVHTWSLAIEEQFYLVWPIVVLVVLGHRSTRSPRRDRRWHFGRGQAPIDSARTKRRRLCLLFTLACVGALASAALMAHLAPRGYDARAYYGTDTRAQALLVGAAIAVGLRLWVNPSQRRLARFASGLGLVGVAGTAVLWATTAETSTFAFRGGFLAASLAAGAVVVGCAVAPRSLVVRFLELPPLPQLGRISYGMYLWYWPILLVTSAGRLHWGTYELFVLRVALTVATAALSYELVEKPVRSGAFRQWRMAAVAPVGAAVALGAVLLSTLVPVGASALQGRQLHPPAAAPTAEQTVQTSKHPLVVESAATPTVQNRAPAGVPAPPTSTTAVPHAPTSKPVKVLLVGDSLAGSLGVGLALEGRQYGVEVVNEGRPSCSVSMQGEIQVLWYTVPPGAPCDVGGNADSVFTTWRQWVDAYNPDVVVYLARGETFNQQVGGAWQSLGEPGFDAYVSSRFSTAAQVLGSRGAAVVFLTVPYSDSGVSGAGSAWPEDNPLRAEFDNAIMREAAASSEGSVYVFDLNALVSPGGHYSPTVGSINVRCRDGVHFSQSGGIFVGRELAPELATLGRAHALTSPGGTWPGALPPSTPPWFSSLPCQ